MIEYNIAIKSCAETVIFITFVPEKPLKKFYRNELENK